MGARTWWNRRRRDQVDGAQQIRDRIVETPEDAATEPDTISMHARHRVTDSLHARVADEDDRDPRASAIRRRLREAGGRR